MQTFKDDYREDEPILPDFSEYGYRWLGILGRNRAGGRVTYRAERVEGGIPVVIKRFSFYSTNWEGLKEIEREASILRGLEHPGIPKYLDTFRHEGTVCSVQEYIAAEHYGSSGKLYLVDFGFSRPCNGSVPVSSVALGTYGFMPPEALFGKLNLSSDIYIVWG
jgi:serine/threonine protein kinase